MQLGNKFTKHIPKPHYKNIERLDRLFLIIVDHLHAISTYLTPHRIINVPRSLSISIPNPVKYR